MLQINIGDKFGDWEVISEGARAKNHRNWLCKCKCGYEKLYTSSYLGLRKLTCCWQCRKEIRKETDKMLCEKYVGKKFGSFIIVKMLDRNEYGSRQWLCRCKCGCERKFLSCYLFGNGKRKATQCDKCCIEEMELDNRITTIPNRFWKRFLDSSVRRGLGVVITQEEAYQLYLTQNKKCALSGLDLYFTNLQTNFNRYTNASLDRIDSFKPYTLDNVQWVHKKINMMKQRYSQDEFVSMCKLVVNKHGGDVDEPTGEKSMMVD